MKKSLWFLSLLSLLCFAAGSTWAETDLMGDEGDFATFRLGDSQTTIEQKYERLVKRHAITAEQSEENDLMLFSVKVLDEDFDGDLVFADGRLIGIQLSQNRGFSVNQFTGELRSFVYKSLIPYVASKYGNAQSAYDYPDPGEIDDGLAVIAEWIDGEKRICVGLSKEENEYFSAIVIDKAAINNDVQDSEAEEDEDEDEAEEDEAED